MRVLFADTGYWIALLDNQDYLNTRATALSREFMADRLVTTYLVVIEVLNFLSTGGSHMRQRAAEWATALHDRQNIEIVWHTDEDIRFAIDRYGMRHDQSWSLTDCASFMLMEERGISEALAHDRDFEQAGFVALLRTPPA